MLLLLVVIQTMGGQCKKIKSLSIASEYSLVQPVDHPSFGLILHLRSDANRLEKAVKRISCPTPESLQVLQKRIEFARDCDNSISTLVRIEQYQLISPDSDEAQLWQNLESSDLCPTNNAAFIILHFQYIPPECCLANVLRHKTDTLDKMRHRLGTNVVAAAQAVRLFDYVEIDRLQSQQRQVVNQYYQEIEVVRMIDHLVGALYFLNHFDVPHGAVRLESVLVDGEGKYVLVDKDLFAQKSNYQRAAQLLQKIQSSADKNSSEGIQFLAPENLIDLRQKSPSPTTSFQKIDIYCVGLIALRMCLVETQQPLYSYSHQSHSLRLNEQLLTNRLTAVRNRYSPELANLLTRILKRDPRERLDFAELIDSLNPLLLGNLEAIKLIHNPSPPPPPPTKPKEQLLPPQDKNELKQKLISIEEQFQKVMNNRTMLLHRGVNEKEIRQDEHKILKKLEKIKHIRSAFQTTEAATARKINHHPTPKVPVFNLSSAPSQLSTPTVVAVGSPGHESKRYLSGKELQAIVWKEYENIKLQKRGI